MNIARLRYPTGVLAWTLLRNVCLPHLLGMAIFSPDTFATAVILANNSENTSLEFFKLALFGLSQVVFASIRAEIGWVGKRAVHSC